MYATLRTRTYAEISALLTIWQQLLQSTSFLTSASSGQEQRRGQIRQREQVDEGTPGSDLMPPPPRKSPPQASSTTGRDLGPSRWNMPEDKGDQGTARNGARSFMSSRFLTPQERSQSRTELRTPFRDATLATSGQPEERQEGPSDGQQSGGQSEATDEHTGGYSVRTQFSSEQQWASSSEDEDILWQSLPPMDETAVADAQQNSPEGTATGENDIGHGSVGLVGGLAAHGSGEGRSSHTSPRNKSSRDQEQDQDPYAGKSNLTSPNYSQEHSGHDDSSGSYDANGGNRSSSPPPVRSPRLFALDG